MQPWVPSKWNKKSNQSPKRELELVTENAEQITNCLRLPLHHRLGRRNIAAGEVRQCWWNVSKSKSSYFHVSVNNKSSFDSSSSLLFTLTGSVGLEKIFKWFPNAITCPVYFPSRSRGFSSSIRSARLTRHLKPLLIYLTRSYIFNPPRRELKLQVSFCLVFSAYRHYLFVKGIWGCRQYLFCWEFIDRSPRTPFLSVYFYDVEIKTVQRAHNFLAGSAQWKIQPKSLRMVHKFLDYFIKGWSCLLFKGFVSCPAWWKLINYITFSIGILPVSVLMLIFA